MKVFAVFLGYLFCQLVCTHGKDKSTKDSTIPTIYPWNVTKLYPQSYYENINEFLNRITKGKQYNKSVEMHELLKVNKSILILTGSDNVVNFLFRLGEYQSK